MNKKALCASDICGKFIRPAKERAGWGAMNQHYREHLLRARVAQAINFALLLDVPFSFFSKGVGFVFRDATLADGVLGRCS